MHIGHAILAVSLCAVALGAAANDIAGVRLGALLADTKTALSKVHSKYAFTPLLSPAGKEGGLIATSTSKVPGMTPASAPLPVDEFVVMHDDKGVVWYLSHGEVFAEGAKRPLKAVMDQLTKQYGTPTRNVRFIAHMVFWEFDLNGKQAGPSPERTPCAMGSMIGKSIAGTRAHSVREVPATCGKMIRATFGSDKDDMVSGVNVTMYDAKSMAAYLKEEAKLGPARK